MDTNHKDETEKLVEKTSDTQDSHDEANTSQHTEHSTESHDPKTAKPTRKQVYLSGHHKTVEAIHDDILDHDEKAAYTHETDFVSQSSSKLGNRGWKRSKKNMPQLKKDLQYGQYLHVPKAQKAIFSSAAQRRRKKRITAAILIGIILIVILIVIYILH